jgi:alpha-beta hydrolase superfamily lysophospholipase
MSHSQGTFEAFDGTTLFYQSWVPDDEPKAVLAIVHGFGEHSGRYGNVVKVLVPRGIAVYGFDLRGHGRSHGQRSYIRDWSEYRRDLRSFLDLVRSQQPGRPLFLMGHSLGGPIVLEYVLRDPEGLRGVIASGPTLTRPGIHPLLIALSRILSRVLPRLTLDTKLDATAISRDPAVVEAYVSDPLVHSEGTARLGAEMMKAIDWVCAHAAELRAPLLILHGSADRLSPPEGSRAFFDHVTLTDKERREYADFFHEPHNDTGWEQPMTDLADWLEGHL